MAAIAAINCSYSCNFWEVKGWEEVCGVVLRVFWSSRMLSSMLEAVDIWLPGRVCDIWRGSLSALDIWEECLDAVFFVIFTVFFCCFIVSSLWDLPQLVFCCFSGWCWCLSSFFAALESFFWRFSELLRRNPSFLNRKCCSRQPNIEFMAAIAAINGSYSCHKLQL